jgi:hypothetical protein
LQTLAQRIGIGTELQLGATVAAQGETEDRLRVRVRLVENGRIGVRRKISNGARDLIAYVARGGIEIGIEGEFGGDLAGSLATRRRERAYSGDGVHSLLQRLGDLRLHDFCRRTGITRRNRQRGRIDSRILAHRQLRNADRARQSDE